MDVADAVGGLLPGRVLRTGWTLLRGCPAADACLPARAGRIDLRSTPERGPLPEDAGRMRHLPIDVPGVARRLSGRPLEAQYAALYQDMVGQCGESIGAVIRAVADGLSHGTVIGCSLGKDRTGVTIALLLRLLDVPVADILAADRAALTAASGCDVAMAEYARVRGVSTDELVRRFGAGTPALATLLHTVDERYGGVEAYVLAHGVPEADVYALRGGLLRRPS
ncbi:tyrosine-protein phosphatase [Streptomyces aurantiacus]|uniref:Tyrosine-protein phosphatase n=1 Tax=Streptomyces aurantiacus JA 4570 TaxID=1286094 RepID=S4AZC3_9ACTN|nr:tyrosine-protein phosphatase [Streptomyces aurantiacus]EPH46687.1 hypothetical protein STRAU_0240 [Streptomyces aurantiacus JA 4570]